MTSKPARRIVPQALPPAPAVASPPSSQRGAGGDGSGGALSASARPAPTAAAQAAASKAVEKALGKGRHVYVSLGVAGVPEPTATGDDANVVDWKAILGSLGLKRGSAARAAARKDAEAASPGPGGARGPAHPPALGPGMKAARQDAWASVLERIERQYVCRGGGGGGEDGDDDGTSSSSSSESSEGGGSGLSSEGGSAELDGVDDDDAVGGSGSQAKDEDGGGDDDEGEEVDGGGDGSGDEGGGTGAGAGVGAAKPKTGSAAKPAKPLPPSKKAAKAGAQQLKGPGGRPDDYEYDDGFLDDAELEKVARAGARAGRTRHRGFYINRGAIEVEGGGTKRGGGGGGGGGSDAKRARGGSPRPGGGGGGSTGGGGSPRPTSGGGGDYAPPAELVVCVEAVEAAAAGAPHPPPGAARTVLPASVVEPLARTAAAADRVLGRSLVGSVGPGRSWLNARLFAALSPWTKRGNMTARMRAELERLAVEVRVAGKALERAAQGAAAAAGAGGGGDPASLPSITWTPVVDAAVRAYVLAAGAGAGWAGGEAEAGETERALALHSRVAALLAAGGVGGPDALLEPGAEHAADPGPPILAGVDAAAVKAAVDRAGGGGGGAAAAAPRGRGRPPSHTGGGSSRGGSPVPRSRSGTPGAGVFDADAVAATVAAAPAFGGFAAGTPEAWAAGAGAADPALIRSSASRLTGPRSGKLKAALGRALLAVGPAGVSVAEAIAVVNAARLQPSPADHPWATDKPKRQAVSAALGGEPEAFVVVATRGKGFVYGHIAFPEVAAKKAELAAKAAAAAAGAAAPPPPPPPPAQPPAASDAIDQGAINALLAQPEILGDPAALAAAIGQLPPATAAAVWALVGGGGGG